MIKYSLKNIGSRVLLLSEAFEVIISILPGLELDFPTSYMFSIFSFTLYTVMCPLYGTYLNSKVLWIFNLPSVKTSYQARAQSLLSGVSALGCSPAVTATELSSLWLATKVRIVPSFQFHKSHCAWLQESRRILSPQTVPAYTTIPQQPMDHALIIFIFTPDKTVSSVCPTHQNFTHLSHS